jgi:hypothetical protein
VSIYIPEELVGQVSRCRLGEIGRSGRVGGTVDACGQGNRDGRVR